MHRTLSDDGVKKLKVKAKRYAVSDPELRGHWIRISHTGKKSFWAVASNPDGKQIWSHIAPTDTTTIEAARDKARNILTRVRAGKPVAEPKSETFGAALDGWLKRHVEKNGLRSRAKIDDLIARHISEDFRAQPITAVRKKVIAALLDEIEDDHGAPQADLVLSIIRRAMNWYASRDDDYDAPFVKGLRRTNPEERARERTLDDDEIRAVWALADKSGTYGALLKLLLLTGQRLSKVIAMKWTAISPMKWPSNEPPVWEIATSLREKGNIGAVQLPAAVLAVLDTLPRYASNPYILAGRGSAHIAYSGNPKRAFDAKLPKGMKPWTLHDLRRTARSLMSRAGVQPDHAERALGHAIKGVRKVYDRYEFFDEKSEALAKLAALIDRIVNPPADVVVPIRKEIR